MILLVSGNMCIEHRNLTWTLMQLFLAGVLCNTWKVEYQQQLICAVKGSSVVIPCSLHHPDNLKVERVRWGHVKFPPRTGRFIFDSSLRKVTPRIQYIGDRHHNCSLKIHRVEHDDAGKYTVRLNNDEKFRRPSPTLKVVDLSISVSGKEPTKEGDSVNLTCMSGCDGYHLSSSFTWFKNGEPINEGPVLHLSNMSSTDSGNYTCSLNPTTSAAINIDVEYGPKNTSVSVRPVMEVDAGSNITLICSSRANPPVENYTWFKIDDDDDNIIEVGHQPVLLSGEGGRYLCSVANKHGSQNSSVVTLKMKAHWGTFTRNVLIVAAVAVLLIVTTFIAIRRLGKKRTWEPKTDGEEDIQNTDYVNWHICDQSQERNHCEGWTTELVYATVDFNAVRTSNMEQQMDSQSVIYSTVCRSQLLNPSYIETT